MGGANFISVALLTSLSLFQYVIVFLDVVRDSRDALTFDLCCMSVKCCHRKLMIKKCQSNG